MCFGRASECIRLNHTHVFRYVFFHVRKKGETQLYNKSFVSSSPVPSSDLVFQAGDLLS